MSRHPRFTTCQYCHSEIPMAVEGIHMRRCQSKNLEGARSRLREREKRANNQRGAMSWKGEMFQCYLCGEMQGMSDLDDHLRICPNKEIECRDCGLHFPKNLISEHNAVCQAEDSEENDSVSLNSNSNSIDLSDSDSEDEVNNDIGQSQFWSSSEDSEEESEDDSSSNVREVQSLDQRQNEVNRRIREMCEGSHYNQELYPNLLEELEALHRAIRRRAREQDSHRRGGMKSQDIKSLPSKKYIFRGKDRDTCSICYTDFIHNEQVLDLQCQHLFHIECLSEWLVRNKTCPNCKRVITSNKRTQRNNNTIARLFGDKSSISSHGKSKK